MKRLMMMLVALGVLFVLTPATAEEAAEEAPGDKQTESAKVDYLIVSADGLAEVAREWAEYRAGHGRVTRVVTVGEIAESVSVERANINQIKNAIDRAARGGPEGEITAGFQVLLLGAVPNEGTRNHDPASEIPWQMTRMVDANAEPSRRRTVPTDNFYADLIPDDNQLPDIAVGRIPARTPEQARAALEKVKAYEAAPEGDWMRNLTFFAGEGRFGAAFDRLLENLFTQFVEQSISQSYQVRMTYANINSSYAYAPSRLSQKVLDEANAGALMLVYMGHGLHDRLDDMYVDVGGRRLRYPILTRDDVSKFAIPDGKLPIMMILACRTGAMDHADGCLANAICFEPNAPIAVLGSSRDCHPYSNVLLQKAFISEFSERGTKTVGEALLNAKRELIEATDPDRSRLELMASFVIPRKSERDELNRSHLAMYNLTGDPGLRVHYPSLDLTNGAAEMTDGGIVIRATMPATFTPQDLEWEATVETRRSVVAGELEPFNAADLASGDAEKRREAENALARNHHVSNDKVVARMKVEYQGASRTSGVPTARLLLEGKLERPLAPGDYILKLSARDPEGTRYGFTSATLTIKE